MNTSIEHTPGAARLQKAEAALQQLTTERDQILDRQQRAAQEIEALNEAIATGERAGNADTLVVLRSQRQTAQDGIQDLKCTIDSVDLDIQAAQGELTMARRHEASERYDVLRTRQVELLKTIQDAVDLIAETFVEKEQLAVRQNCILANVRSSGNSNPAALRQELAQAITDRLQGRVPTPLRTLDWSSWAMTEQGDLLR